MRLLDPAPVQAPPFARLTRLAELTLDVPLALVVLAGESDRNPSVPNALCAQVTETGEALVLRDVRDHPTRSADVGGFAGVPLVAADGGVLGALCVVDTEARDWTEQELEILITLAEAVTARAQLLVSAERSALLAEDKQAILESSLDCIVVMDQRGHVREWNPASVRTFGYTREEALGRRLGDLIVPEELRARHEEGLKRAAETGDSRIMGQRLRLPALRKDGSSFTAELTITKVEREGQAVFTGTLRDVTDTVRAEDDLRAAEHRHRDLVERLPLTTYVTAPDGGVLHTSPQIERLLGHAPDEWLAGGREMYERAVHPDDLDQVQAESRIARAESTFFRSEYRMLHRDGRVVWVLDEMAPTIEPDGSVSWRGFMLDVTERKQLEEQLRQSQKMEAIGQLAGGIAHDFNNMLTAIGGYADLLAHSFDADDPRVDDVEQIRKAAGHAAALTRQLLAFGRKQMLRPQRLEVNDVVRDLEKMLARTIGCEVELEVSLAEGLAPVETDPDQLVQVILNIALNGRDAMPDGGLLRLATGSVESGGDRYVAVDVTDTGTGIAEHVRNRLFEPFFTTKDQGKGTGLGLATAYGVVSQSGGRIEVETVLGEGSTFRILLPAAA